MERNEKRFLLKSFLAGDFWQAFFMGRAYPLLVAALVLFGNLTSLDYYINFIITGLLVFAMLISDTARPLIITACSYIYQISISHAPGYPTYSDFFFSEWRKWTSVIIIAVVVAALTFFFVKNKIYKCLFSEKSSLLFSALTFSFALILNGIFSDDWIYKNLIFGFLNTLVYFFLFITIFYGLKKEKNAKELIDYFCYISLLLSAVIITQMICLFIGGKVFSNGAIVKENMALGWGIWNIIGTSLAVLIPVLFYGAMKGKWWYLYFVFATLSYIFSILSMSRNALVFSSIAYLLCIIISCFFAEKKRIYRILFIFGATLFTILAIIFFEDIKIVFYDYFERGFSDNGRYALWKLAIETFRKSPVFGNGFYGFFTDDIFEYSSFPRMAHNTVFQILSSMGIIGILAYGWYRIETLKVVIKRPTLAKTMLGISMLIFLLGSLLDNFVFNLHPPIYYTVALVLCCHIDRE